MPILLIAISTTTIGISCKIGIDLWNNLFFSYRIECEDRIIAYTGDTEWTDALVDTGGDADLFISESYFYEKKVKFHLDYATLLDHLPAIEPKRLVLTHMSDDMLSRFENVPHEVAEDGKVLEL